jgi:hypothetical protein
MKRFFHLVLFSLVSVTVSPQSIPDGYILVYQQNFSSVAALKDFIFSSPGSWKISTFKDNRFLECNNLSRYTPVFPSPAIIAIINHHILGEFILEADLMIPGTDQEEKDLCILFSVKDSLRYYYIQMASLANDSTYGIFLVKNAPRRRVSDWQTEGITWGNQKWHRVRVVRNIVNRSVSVYFDDMIHPVMTSRDPELVMGYLGFGTFNSQCCIDNIKIWAPTSIPEEAGFFRFSGNP